MKYQSPTNPENGKYAKVLMTSRTYRIIAIASLVSIILAILSLLLFDLVNVTMLTFSSTISLFDIISGDALITTDSLVLLFIALIPLAVGNIAAIVLEKYNKDKTFDKDSMEKLILVYPVANIVGAIVSVILIVNFPNMAIWQEDALSSYASAGAGLILSGLFFVIGLACTSMCDYMINQVMVLKNETMIKFLKITFPDENESALEDVTQSVVAVATSERTCSDACDTDESRDEEIFSKLKNIKQLVDDGTITQEEFEKKKTELINKI